MESQPNISGEFLHFCSDFLWRFLALFYLIECCFLTLFIFSIHSCIFLQFLYAVFKLRFIEDTLPLQGEQGRLAGTREENPARSRLPLDICKAVPACLPSCPLPSLEIMRRDFSELALPFSRKRFLPDGNSISASLARFASLTVMACFPERETLRRSFNFCGRSFASNFNFHKNDSKR